MKMKYNGSGEFVPGIPARDLTADEVRQLGGVDAILKATPKGLYSEVGAASKPKAAPKVEDENNG